MEIGRYRNRAARRVARGKTRLVTLLITMLLAAAAPLWLSLPASAQSEPDSGGPSPAPGSGWTDYDSQPLRVNVWQGNGDERTYSPGEALRVGFSTNRDAYAVVYRIDSDGEVTILWPRSRYDDGFVFGGRDYDLSGPSAARIRVSDEAGQEYVEAIASQYPFDLRDLEVDFAQEPTDDPYHYRVVGDPFLAMNEVNYAITRLDNSEDFVVTNYVSYNVGRDVDHPRYLCAQCHTSDVAPDPYGSSCTLAIHHDFGWSNRWFVRFGYYPVYYYPAYYYVDPWTWEPWVNYWYTPWYWWPSVHVYDWPYSCHVWSHSPFWHGDSWSRWRDGDRRYLPLDKRYLTDGARRSQFLDRGSLLVKAPRPGTDAGRVLDRRFKDFERDPSLVRGGPGKGGPRGEPAVYRDVRAERRDAVKYRGAERAGSGTPGLRVPDGSRIRRSPASDRPRGGAGATYRQDAGRSAPWGRGSDLRTREQGRNLRTVEPRRPGARIWSGGRANPYPDREVRPGSAGDRGRGAQPPEVRERSGSGPSGRPEVRQSSPRSQRGSEGRSAPQSGGGRSRGAAKRR